MANASVIQRHAHLAGAVKLEFVNGREGSSQLSIRRPVLDQLALSIPAVEEQRRIVALAELAQRERRALQRLITNREQQLQAIAEDLSAPATHTRMQEKK
ncbi:hypothetical protein [Variovorax sp. YR752]|uniref:hypothetical protein n=1 Tax=Variovorax sp. YR752 TaxID=1884383 RepID=UPI003137FCB3